MSYVDNTVIVRRRLADSLVRHRVNIAYDAPAKLWTTALSCLIQLISVAIRDPFHDGNDKAKVQYQYGPPWMLIKPFRGWSRGVCWFEIQPKRRTMGFKNSTILHYLYVKLDVFRSLVVTDTFSLRIDRFDNFIYSAQSDILCAFQNSTDQIFIILLTLISEMTMRLESVHRISAY
jgi:hypothetical protein